MQSSKTATDNTQADTDNSLPLNDLRERLGDAQRAASQLLAGFADASGGTDGRQTPPQGFATGPEHDQRSDSQEFAYDLHTLFATLAGMRGMLPDDLRQQMADALKEFLTALQAVIEWILSYLEARKAPESTLQEIPIL